MSQCIKGQAVKLGVEHPAYRKNSAVLARWKFKLDVTDVDTVSKPFRWALSFLLDQV